MHGVVHCIYDESPRQRGNFPGMCSLPDLIPTFLSSNKNSCKHNFHFILKEKCTQHKFHVHYIWWVLYLGLLMIR